MSDHDHNHGSHNHAGQRHHEPRPARTGIHKDWRVWVMIGLMLLGMLIYILTLDESRTP